MIDELDLLSLGAPAGSGQANDPADIAALDNSLRRIDAYTPPPEYAGEPQRYATEPMIRALEKFQEQNRLKIDGYANPNGPTERAINNRLLEKPRGAGLLLDPPTSLGGSVGNGFDNRPHDVATVQRILGALGEMPEDPFDRPRGFIDENTTGAIKAFQRKHGLADDGWLAANGETERALHDAVAALARASGRDWLRFAERAGRAQASLTDMLDSRRHALARRPKVLASHRDGGPDTEEEGEVIRVQSRGALGRIPTPTPPWIGIDPETAEITPGSPADALRRFFQLAGRYAGRTVRMGEIQREDLPESEKSGGKTEVIPPRTDKQPYRGTDAARPPLDPKLTGPSPSPSEPPHKLPDREEIRPETLKPDDWTLITPAIRPWSASDLALLNRGNARTQGRLVRLRELGEKVASERSDVRLVHIGGARTADGEKMTEFYAERPFRKELGIKTIAGSAFADLTFWDPDSKRLNHISLYRVTSGTKPLQEEVEQSVRLAANKIGQTELIVMIPNVRGDDFVDAETFKRFLHATLDSLRGAPKATDMSDAASRDRVIRYFTEFGPK